VRIDEFSNMGAGVAGLSDTERMRFVCFGFDLVPGAITIVGIVRAVITAKVAHIHVTATT
jgi:hypothetical protein